MYHTLVDKMIFNMILHLFFSLKITASGRLIPPDGRVIRNNKVIYRPSEIHLAGKKNIAPVEPGD